MKIALYQNHSKNNSELFQLTLPNHVRYCEEHEYDMIFPHTVYSTFLDQTPLKKCLVSYDAVVCVGSDVIFTDMKTPLSKFIDGDTSIGLYIAEEGRWPTSYAWTNFDFNIWMKGDAVDLVLDTIEYLEDNRTTQRPPVPTLFGTQSTIDYILRHRPDVQKHIRVHKPRVLQSLPHEYDQMGLTAYNKPNYWHHGDFSIHFLTGDNKWKHDKCKQFLLDHPDIV